MVIRKVKMKRSKFAFLTFLLLFTLTACFDDNTFKNDYEELNGQPGEFGDNYREVKIPKKNPIVIAKAKDIVDMIENEESFYDGFGSCCHHAEQLRQQDERSQRV